MTVNGKSVSGEVEARTLLVQFLREHLRLTGTHVGYAIPASAVLYDWEIGDVIHKDGQSLKSCTILAAQCDRMLVGASALKLQPSKALLMAIRCIRCKRLSVKTTAYNAVFLYKHRTPGMVMSALDLVKNNPDPSETEIREWLEEAISAAAPGTIIS